MAETEIETEIETENEESNQIDNEPSSEAEENSSEENQKPDDLLSSRSGQINSDVLQNIPVTISVEVGRTSLKIRDLMRLTQGSVVELDRIAGEPLDLLVNDTLVAQGEIVLVNERYGVRLTSVIPAADRVKNL